LDIWEKTGIEPVLEQLQRKKWHWTGHTLRRSDDSITMQTPTVGTAGKTATHEDQEKSVEKELRMVDLQIQLQVNGGGSKRHKTELGSGTNSL